MTKRTNNRRQTPINIESRQKRRAVQSAMSAGLRTRFKPLAQGSKMDDFMALLERADRKASKA
ncbi:hypothetical protein [Henriciella sp.]|uniref:hypothetical protein n=1 Tax=Henriciella sp. TaxID=1968823 RepID=UPI003C75A43E